VADADHHHPLARKCRGIKFRLIRIPARQPVVKPEKNRLQRRPGSVGNRTGGDIQIEAVLAARGHPPPVKVRALRLIGGGEMTVLHRDRRVGVADVHPGPRRRVRGRAKTQRAHRWRGIRNAAKHRDAFVAAVSGTPRPGRNVSVRSCRAVTMFSLLSWFPYCPAVRPIRHVSVSIRQHHERKDTIK
jgi:hypothetical protein